ncbi:hypothetical protein J6590_079308 [Homalodisca vitripennis]|nr:hypothetical protein J6590_079308 [Homalodisca vitripennis]
MGPRIQTGAICVGNDPTLEDGGIVALAFTIICEIVIIDPLAFGSSSEELLLYIRLDLVLYNEITITSVNLL